jgi:hypothetical protein
MKNVGSDIERLKQAGIPVRIDTSPSHMHHKVFGAPPQFDLWKEIPPPSTPSCGSVHSLLSWMGVCW